MTVLLSDPRVAAVPVRECGEPLVALDARFGPARARERVEVACRGGVGRTGTALAALAVLDGLPAPDAVRWVRGRYHPRAVETPWQRRWLRSLGAGDGGPVPGPA